jgi:bacteriocin biosynthesis cyclodehydratase domain-containing protein
VSWRRGLDVALTVAAPAPDEVDALPWWNELALRRDLTWLPLRPFDGRMVAIGPIVVPGESCCYGCVLLRRAANVDYGDDLAEIEAAPVAAAADPPFDALAAGLCAHLALRWLVAGDTTLPGVMFALEPRPALTLSEHFVLRVPRCGACSNSARFAPRLPWHEARAA